MLPQNMLFLFVLVIGSVNAATSPLQEPPMDNKGKTATAYFDQTSTAYFRPPQLILSSSPPGAVSVVQPMIKFMQPIHYVRPGIQQPATITFVQQSPATQSQFQYDPSKPSQIIRAVQRGKHIPILRMASDFNFDGTFNYAYDTGNGISMQTIGTIKDIGQDRRAQVMHGTYSYIAPDGTPISTTWYADETGFHAEGAHLPTPPPIPEVIASSIEFNKNTAPSAILLPGK